VVKLTVKGVIMSEFGFPTETIDLPSGGKLYPEGSPLRSGKLDIRYMTAKHEDILTSTNLIQKGIVIDKLMEALIATPGVTPDDLLTGDLNAAMVAARILAYGKDYSIELGCGSCGTKFDHVVDLSGLETISPEDTSENGEHTVTLPTGVVVTFKLLTRGNEKEIQAEVDGLKKFNNSIEGDGTTRLKYTISSVNGNRDKKTIREFVDAMIIRDVRAFREAYKKVSPDVQFELNISCSNCDHSNKTRMPFGSNFFWPDLGT
jgi:hypothetical protein